MNYNNTTTTNYTNQNPYNINSEINGNSTIIQIKTHITSIAKLMEIQQIPREDVQFTLNNMNNLILTIPTQEGPNWMIEEIKESNKLKNQNEEFTIF